MSNAIFAVLTKTGAELQIIDHKLLQSEQQEHLGEGSMLVLKMQDPLDLRRSEVFLDPDAKQKLAEALLSPEERRLLAWGRLSQVMQKMEEEGTL